MSKFAQLLKMVEILNLGHVVKTKDLAEELGVSVRMIRKYAEDIKEADLPIRSIPGPTGGFYFDCEEYKKNWKYKCKCGELMNYLETKRLEQLGYISFRCRSCSSEDIVLIESPFIIKR